MDCNLGIIPISQHITKEEEGEEEEEEEKRKEKKRKEKKKGNDGRGAICTAQNVRSGGWSSAGVLLPGACRGVCEGRRG